MTSHDDAPLPGPWDPWEAHEQDAPRPPALEVYLDDVEPLGPLYGPRGEILAIVEPDRLPFGFHP